MMGKRIIGATVAIVVAAVPLSAAVAAGTPQRSGDLPPGLEKNLARAIPGLLRAMLVTEGSNSRLQELPVSP